MSKRILRVSSCALSTVLIAAKADAQVLYVDDSAPPGGDGSSWALALDDLSSALAGAALPAVQQVWVAEGRYLPSASDPNASFVLPDGVPVYGGFAGTETSLDQRVPALHPTILDGDLNGDDQPDCVGYDDNSEHVVRDSGGASTYLDGFTVRGGRGNLGAGMSLTAEEVTLARVILEENCSPGMTIGGGAYVRADRVELASCVVQDNLGGAGAGLFLRAPQHVLVTGCRFERQEGDLGGGLNIEGVSVGEVVVLDSVFQDATVTNGGGVRLEGSYVSFRVQRCTFEGNRATSGGGIAVYSLAPGPVFVSDCAFLDNTANTGGGLYLYAVEIPLLAEISRCSFQDNHACSGGGIFTYSGPITVTDCEFRSNHLKTSCGVGQGGGALRAEGRRASIVARNSILSRSNNSLVYALEGRVELDLCSLWNGGGSVPSIRLVGPSSVALENCVVWGGAPAQIAANTAASVSAVYSDVRNGGTGLPGTGNFEADPLFRSEGTDDLRLQPGSPCIEAGDPARIVAGADAQGSSRMTDGDLDGVLRIDMGAHEASPIELAVTGLPVAGGILTFQTSGQSGLTTFLGVDRPGLHFFPFAGTLFLSLTGGFFADWAPAPSTTPVTVPPGLAGLFHAQMIVLGNGAIAFSNFVPLSF